MADVTDRWALAVEVESRSALEGARALEKYRDELVLAESKLKTVQATMRAYKGTNLGTKEEIDKLRNSEKAAKEAVAQAHKAFLGAGGNLRDKYKPAVKEAAEESDALKDALMRSIPGASRVSAALRGVSLSAAGLTAGAVLAVAAVVALTIALAAATVAATKFALVQADAARNQRLAIEQSLIYDQMLGRLRGIKDATAYAEQYDQAISRVARNVPQARSEVASTFAELQKFRLTGDLLEKAARASLLVGGVGRFMALGYSAQYAGKGIRATAELIEKKFGDTNKRAMMSLSVQVLKLKESFLGMFRTLRIDSFLSAFQKFADLFSETTVTGQALKTIVENLFGPLSKDAGIVGPLVKAVFEGIVIAALYATLGVLKFRNWLARTFDSETIGKIDMFQVSLGVAAITLGVATAAAVMLAAVLAGIASPILVAVGAIYLLQDGFKWFESLDLVATGLNLMTGLAEGIKSGAVKVLLAVGEVATGIIDKISGALGIRSPSKFGIYAGKMLGEGVSIGARSKAPDVQAASAGLAVAAAGGLGGNARSSSTNRVEVHAPITLNFQGSEQPTDFAREAVEAMIGELERLCREMGVTLHTGVTG